MFTKDEIANEVWKDVPNYEGIYQVSDLGRVRSLERSITRSNGWVQTFKPRIRKTFIDRKGYEVVDLWYMGVGRKVKVHKAVAIAFLGHIPDGYKTIINHIDGNTLNNRLINLEEETQRGNCTKGKKSTESKSQYVGVGYINRKGRRVTDMNPCWKASISFKQQQVGLGTRPLTPEGELECSELYQKALAKLLSDETYYEENIQILSNKEKREYLLN